MSNNQVNKNETNQSPPLSDKRKAFITGAAIFVIILLYGIAFTFRSSSGSIQKSTVTYDNQSVKINVTGYVVRDETHVSQSDKNDRSPLIERGKNDNIGMIIEDGDYVSYNEEIARVFGGADEYAAWQKYAELEDELEVLGRLSEYSSNSSDLDSINLEITSLLRQYVDEIDGSPTDNLTYLLQSLAYQIGTMKPVENIEETVSALNSELNAYRSKFSYSSAVTSPSAGYFCNEVDGLEKSIDYTDVSENGITVSKLEKLLEKESKPDSSYLGKIVYQNNWYYAFKTSASFAGEYLKRGSYIKVSFPNRGISDITMVVSKKVRDGDDVCVTCRCSSVSPELLHLRIEDAIISARSVEGFKLANNSIVTIDGITGVYVSTANRSIFKPINIVYGTEDSSICRSVSSDEFISLYGEGKYLDLISDVTKAHYKFQLDKANEKRSPLFAEFFSEEGLMLDDQEISQFSIEETKVRVKKEEGYKIPNESIVINDGVKGLTVKDGNEEVFKPLMVIKSMKDSSICRPITSDEFIKLYSNSKFLKLISKSLKKGHEKEINEVKDGFASLYARMYSYDNRVLNDYDITIVKGRNLYDGKFID